VHFLTGWSIHKRIDSLVRETPFVSRFYVSKPINLPRQALDKHDTFDPKDGFL
jgi:hypothetical protein